MKKNIIKKLACATVAFSMVAALGTAVFADSENVEFPAGGNETSVAKPETAGNDLSSVKFKVYFNKDASADYLTTKFHYSITPGTGHTATATEPAILAGITGGANITNTSTDAWDTQTSTEASDLITVTFDGSLFTVPGIYRYVITQDALSSEQQALGIKAETYAMDSEGNVTSSTTTDAVTRYLDVYVDNNNKVTSAVLLKTLEIPTLQDTDNDNILDASAYHTANKTDGFTNEETLYSFKIKKVVDGSMADSTKQFEFSVGLNYNQPATDDAGTSAADMNFLYKTDEDTAAIQGTIGTPVTINLKADEEVEFTYVPATVIGAVEEIIDAGEGYTIVITEGTDKSVTLTSNNATATDKCKTNAQANFVVNATTDEDTIIVTNTRNVISPTGVIVRYAPYIIMIGAAGVLSVVAIRSKRKAEEA